MALELLGMYWGLIAILVGFVATVIFGFVGYEWQQQHSGTQAKQNYMYAAFGFGAGGLFFFIIGIIATTKRLGIFVPETFIKKGGGGGGGQE
jgi:uncharacterized membrane protein